MITIIAIFVSAIAISYLVHMLQLHTEMQVYRYQKVKEFDAAVARINGTTRQGTLHCFGECLPCQEGHHAECKSRGACACTF